MKIELRLDPEFGTDEWTIIAADGEFQGLEANKLMGTIREMPVDVQRASDSMLRGSNAALKLAGSKQDVPAIRKDVTGRDTVKCICEKRIGEDGEPYIAILGVASEEIKLLNVKK